MFTHCPETWPIPVLFKQIAKNGVDQVNYQSAVRGKQSIYSRCSKWMQEGSRYFGGVCAVGKVYSIGLDFKERTTAFGKDRKSMERTMVLDGLNRSLRKGRFRSSEAYMDGHMDKQIIKSGTRERDQCERSRAHTGKWLHPLPGRYR